MSSFPEALTDRYRRFKHRHFVPNADHYEELATYGQNPETMVISCSDSRVDPETIFSAMPGELFILRNVANLVPPYETGGKYHGVSSAIEFAVLNLRVKHLIVMGHSGLRRRQGRARSERRHPDGSAVHFALDVDARRRPPHGARRPPKTSRQAAQAGRTGEGRRQTRRSRTCARSRSSER